MGEISQDKIDSINRHEWWDKIAYGIIIFAAGLIWNTGETNKAMLQDIQISTAEILVVQRDHSRRIQKLENKMEEYDANIKEFYKKYKDNNQ